MADLGTAHRAAIPEWVTLREASFITGQSEQALWGRIEAGLLSKDDHLSERLGLRFVLVRVQDLVATGLIGPGLLPGQPPEAPKAGRAGDGEPSSGDLQRLLSHIERDAGRPIFVNDETPPAAWADPPPSPSTPPRDEARPAGAAPQPPPPHAAPSEPVVPSGRTSEGGKPPAPVGGRLPTWMTISEAAFMAGVDEDALRGSVHAGRVTADPSLVQRLGPRFLLVRTSDLTDAGLLRDGPRPSGGPPPARDESADAVPGPPLAARPEPVPAGDADGGAVIVPLAQSPLEFPQDGSPRATSAPTARTDIEATPAPMRPDTLPEQRPPQAPAAWAAESAPIHPSPGRSASLPPGLPGPAVAPALRREKPRPGVWAPRPRGRPAARMGRVAVMTLSVLRWVLLGVAAGMIALVVASPLFGYRTFVMTSPSMEPALARGDLLVDRLILPTEAKVGDIVTFRDPDHPDSVRTGRVWTIQPGDDVVRFETRGDAGDDEVAWSVAADGHISRVAMHVSRVGALSQWFRERPERSLVVVVPLLVVPWLHRFRGRRARFSWVPS